MNPRFLGGVGCGPGSVRADIVEDWAGAVRPSAEERKRAAGDHPGPSRRHSFFTAFSVGLCEKIQSKNPPLLREQTRTTPSPLNLSITPSPESCE